MGEPPIAQPEDLAEEVSGGFAVVEPLLSCVSSWLFLSSLLVVGFSGEIPPFGGTTCIGWSRGVDVVLFGVGAWVVLWVVFGLYHIQWWWCYLCGARVVSIVVLVPV